MKFDISFKFDGFSLNCVFFIYLSNDKIMFNVTKCDGKSMIYTYIYIYILLPCLLRKIETEERGRENEKEIER